VSLNNPAVGEYWAKSTAYQADHSVRYRVQTEIPDGFQDDVAFGVMALMKF
jgi:hypothetical protein